MNTNQKLELCGLRFNRVFVIATDWEQFKQLKLQSFYISRSL